MALPDLTFYKLPLVPVTVATATGLMEALFLALSSAVDYRGTALPASHLWTFTKIGATSGVRASPPVGTTMLLNPNLIWALGAAAGNSTYLSPDGFTANAPNIGIATDPGAFVAWDNANPWGTGRWSGYWRFGSAPYANIACRIVAYVSQEVVIVTMYTQATGAMVACGLGAILAPHSDTQDTAEKDSRLYGMWTTGGNVVGSFWSTASGILSTATGASAEHLGVFRPRSFSAPAAGVSNASFYTGGRAVWYATGALSQQQSQSGMWPKRPITICENTASVTPSGSALGLLRGTYMLGTGAGQLPLRNVDGTDDLHLVGGAQQGNIGHVFGLQAAA